MRLLMPIPFGQFASFTELLAGYSSPAFGPDRHRLLYPKAKKPVAFVKR